MVGLAIQSATSASIALKQKQKIMKQYNYSKFKIQLIDCTYRTHLAASAAALSLPEQPDDVHADDAHCGPVEGNDRDEDAVEHEGTVDRGRGRYGAQVSRNDFIGKNKFDKGRLVFCHGYEAMAFQNFSLDVFSFQPFS